MDVYSKATAITNDLKTPLVDPKTLRFTPKWVGDMLQVLPYKIDDVYKKYVRMHQLPLETTKEERQRQRRKAKRPKEIGKRKFVVEGKKSFDEVIPLHELWKGYMMELWGKGDAQGMLAKIPKADYHGCWLTLEESRCASFVGLSGIVVQETANTFRLATVQNVIKSVPKKCSIFTFKLNGHVFRLYGNQICYRAAERATKKFKSKSVAL